MEYGSQPPKRPTTSTILDRLNREVDNWGKSIVPPRVEEGTGRSGYHIEDNGRFFFIMTESIAPALT